ncbi:MAG TPA: hypothetical protein VKZ80_00155 [Flavobacterium sp.]|nr:hypothetical protein [Flavobacterium sp.]
MKKVYLLAIASVFAFTACKDNKPEVTSTNAEASAEQPVSNPVNASNSSATAVSNNAPADGLNPPHGQPGHRCEIPVGAPLNSAPPAATQTQTNVQPANNSQGFLSQGSSQAGATQQQVQPQAKSGQQTAPGMQGKPNPPHGQPGHRCDISVGQPLP